MVFPGQESVSNALHHHDLLVSDYYGIQNVSAADAPPAVESPIPVFIERIDKLIRHH
jgi:hypothetical protein